MVVHEEQSNLLMVYEDQAFEFPLGESHTFMEEEEKHTIVELTYGGIHASTCLTDDNCRVVFVMHDLKDTPYEIPLLVVDPSIKEVDDHIPYGSTNKKSY